MCGTLVPASAAHRCGNPATLLCANTALKRAPMPKQLRLLKLRGRWQHNLLGKGLEALLGWCKRRGHASNCVRASPIQGGGWEQ